MSVVCIAAMLAAVTTATEAATSQFPFFDGTDDRVIVENAPALNPSESITIEAWVRPSDTSGCQTIVGKNFNTAWWLGLCNGVIRYYTDGSGTSADGNGTVPAGEWTHVAITFDGVFRRYYINGVEDLFLVSLEPIALPVNTADVGIGGEAAFTSFDLFEFTGTLAEVRIWSHARSRTEIRHDMGRQLSGDQEGLVGLWPLDGGVGEVAERHVSVEAGDPFFSVLPAPATLHQPLRVPRLGTTPDIDANCESVEYNEAAPLPVWYPPDAPAESPVFGLVGADAFGYFLCLENFEVPTGSWFEVWFDPNGDSGSVPGTDDLKFRINKDGSHQAFEGTGLVFDPWSEIATPSGFNFATPSEFFRGLELRVSRNDVEATEGGVFQTAFGVLFDTAEPTFHAWPIQDQWQLEPARILPDPPRPDAERPTITVDPIPSRPVGDEPMTFWARATDDVDLRQIEIFVDPLSGGNPTVPEKICIEEVAGENDNEGICEFDTVLAPGVYSYKARSIDHRGKLRHTRARTVRVTLGGEAPSVSVSHTPEEPASGGPVTLVASASDDTGIDHISIHVNAENRTCEPAGSPTEATCSWALDDPGGVVRYMAWVEDVEALRARTPHRIALLGNDGPDGDGDGISDAHELVYLCTDPDLRDTDKDGLEDGWELLGLEFADGTRTDLPALGAYPCSRDVFVQIDYETGAQFPDNAITLAVGRYLANGIKLHVEENERPRPPTDPMSPLTAPRAAFQLDADGERYFDPRLVWTHHYAYLSHSVGNGWNTNRFVNVSRYFGGPVGHCFGGDNAGNSCLSNGECDSGNCGRACATGPLKGAACTTNSDCPASMCSDNFECPLDAFNPANCGGRLRRGEFDLSYRLIHEVGHSVGMGHGGRQGSRLEQINEDGFFYLDNAWDNVNHKPNYQSVMNYKGGLATEICIEPPFDVPRFKGRFDYSHDELPALDETDLDERSDSEFATALRGLECTDSEDPDARPAVLYYCLVGDEGGLTGDPPRRYFVISDGTQTMWRRPEGGGWSGDVPAHDPGIDWNCDGEIDASVTGSVNGSGGHVSRAWGFSGENCDGNDNDGDGFTDEGCNWDQNEVHERKADWDNLPNLPDCHWLYSTRRSCYVQVENYRNEMPGLANGVPPQDCRPDGDPQDTCDGSVVIDFSGAASTAIGRTNRMHSIYRAAMADVEDSHHSGLASGDPSHEDEIERLPGLEICNGVDDNADGVIDEGCPDRDGDGVVDAIDLCPETPNPDQIDTDGDRISDACQDPRISGLTAEWSDGAARLQWAVSHDDILGFAVYRGDADDATAGFVGADYPSTTGTALIDDSGAAPQPVRYTVHAINLAGEESQGAAVTVDAGVMFVDGFESP